MSNDAGGAMQAFLDTVFYGNSVLSYLIFMLSLLISYLGLLLLKFVLQKVLVKTAQNANVAHRLLRLLVKQMVPLLFSYLFYLNTFELTLDPTLRETLDKAMLSVGIFVSAWIISNGLSMALTAFFDKHDHETKDKSIVNTIKLTVSIIIWILALILLFDNLGLNITSLIAGLGIGGVALAFAAQSILVDLFCWITIIFDKPFALGDYLIVGDKSGTVESIGVKTTRLRSLNGEQIILANSDLTKSRINNFKTLVERRVLFRLGVTFDTSSQKLESIPELIKTLVESTDDTRFGRTHFVAYGPYSLEFEIVYFVLSDDYNLYLDRVQTINLKIKEAFETAGIDIAYPTQVVQYQNTNDV